MLYEVITDKVRIAKGKKKTKKLANELNHIREAFSATGKSGQFSIIVITSYSIHYTKLYDDGILLTLADMRTNLGKTTAHMIRENYGSAINVFKTEIPVGIKAAEGSSVGKSIYSYDGDSKVADAYQQFTREVLDIGAKQQTRIKNADAR